MTRSRARPRAKAVKVWVFFDTRGTLTDIALDGQPGLRLVRLQKEPMAGMVRVEIRPVRPKARRKRG